MFTFVDLEPRRILVILDVLLDNIRRCIAKLLLHGARHQLDVLRRNGLATVTQHLQNKLGNVTARQRYVLDARADHVAIRDRYHMRHTISSVDDGTSQHFLSVLRQSRGNQRQYRLYTNVETRHVERLKHDLGGVLSILGRIQRWLCQQHIVLFRVASHILKQTALPVLFNVVPVVDNTMRQAIFDLIIESFRARFLTDIKLQIAGVTATCV
mmetsp:Transcript_51115/g.84852  ORF Transcript_51115/g.84852 Transcript_51115/m.84852 type:complete len:212 (+) Transcript_51115:894-1529(+)